MEIVVNSKEEAKALKKVLKRYGDMMSSMPSYRGDLIEPQNKHEYVLMWQIFKPKIVVGSTKPLDEQYPDWASEWEDCYE